MRLDQIVRARDGTRRHIVRVNDVKIPGLWHIHEKMLARKMAKQDAQDVLEVWQLAHDLLKHVKRAVKEVGP